MRHSLTRRLTHAAIIGGATSSSTTAGSSRAGCLPVGTMPHALVLIYGDTVEAALAFDRQIDSEVPRIVLVDTFRDESEESTRVAAALGSKLGGVRLDPAAHRITAGSAEVNLGPTEFRLLRHFMEHPGRVFSREQLLDVFRDAADFWAERRIPFRCFYSFAVARANESSAWERVNEAAQVPEKPAPKAPPKNGANPNFGMNMPMMSSAFDTAMWLNAA